MTGLQQPAVSLGMLAAGMAELRVGLLAFELDPLPGRLITLASMALLLYPAVFMPEPVAVVRDRCRATT
ncbi:MAG TPA: hypothetical protein VE083_12085 [Terriglobales bacterium]|nr:hypothetical protein [Terriglobales bacterium]